MTGKILITCSGVSSTGKLTLQAANSFIFRNHGVFERHISAPSINGETEDQLKANNEDLKIVVIDGCPDCCSCKKLKNLEIDPVIHVIATDLGIEKRGMEEPLFTEIDKVHRELKRRVNEL